MQAPPGTKLYKYIRGSTAGKWHLESSAAAPRFYDAKEDARGSGKEWYMEVEAGDIDVRVDEQLQYVADASQHRITFAAGGELWALKFASIDAYREFRTQLGVRHCGMGGLLVGLGVAGASRAAAAVCLLAAVCSQGITCVCLQHSWQQPCDRYCTCQHR